MSDSNQDKLFKDGEVQDALQKSSRAALQDFERASRSSNADEEVKLFGLFPMPAAIAALIGGAVNEGTRHLGNIIVPKAYHISEKLLSENLNVQGKLLARGSTVAAVGANLVLGGGMYFYPLIQSLRKHRQDYKALARAIAPVLEDIRGNHSVGALMSIREEDNEVIYVHRKRMAQKMNLETTNNTIDLLLNVGPKIATTEKLSHMWSGEELRSTQKAREAQRLAELANPELKKDKTSGTSAEKDSKTSSMVEWLKSTVSMGSSPVATYITTRNTRKLQKNSRSFSTLEMIMELDKQVAADPKARSFTTPGHGRRQSYGLEEYILCVMRNHQSEMADINDQHTELRDALTDDALKAASQLAKAIRNGEISALSLVRMVGEGHLIKRHGRAVASADEVRDLIQQASGKQATYVHVDPAEYYKDAAFTKEQLKTALKSLDGEELRIFASMFPNDVLEEAGMSAKDVKAMREATANHYDNVIAEAILGLSELSDEELKKDGLAESEIKQLRKAHHLLQGHGIDAVKEIKTSATNNEGIEHLLTNVTVHKPEYLGKLIGVGREQLKDKGGEHKGERRHEAAKDDDGGHPDRKHLKSHSEREDHRRDREAANHGHARGAVGE